MSGEFIAFFILSLFTIGGAVFMISFTRVVHMVVSLAFTFLSIAGLYVLLEAEFVAVTQVIVYAGAVAIMMLFGIMLTPHREQEEDAGRAQKVVAFIAVAAFFLIAFFIIQGTTWDPSVHHFTEDNTTMIGKTIFTQYVIPFELVSVLLLVALVGAIILAKREENDSE
ncbi:MAG: NADH-quinone oxidoreductase subunit J [Bacillaceae bacterium]|nr:NADH-quinone oxidoreductase subunit J [Bacillaceae bacterium]